MNEEAQRLKEGKDPSITDIAAREQQVPRGLFQCENPPGNKGNRGLSTPEESSRVRWTPRISRIKQDIRPFPATVPRISGVRGEIITFV